MASLTRRVIASLAINKYSPEVAIAARNGRSVVAVAAWDAWAAWAAWAAWDAWAAWGMGRHGSAWVGGWAAWPWGGMGGRSWPWRHGRVMGRHGRGAAWGGGYTRSAGDAT